MNATTLERTNQRTGTYLSYSAGSVEKAVMWNGDLFQHACLKYLYFRESFIFVRGLDILTVVGIVQFSKSLIKKEVSFISFDILTIIYLSIYLPLLLRVDYLTCNWDRLLSVGGGCGG